MTARQLYRPLYILGLVTLVCAAGCGTKSPAEIQVDLQFSGDNPFDDSAVNDIVFLVAATDDLDQQLVFPDACASSSPALEAGCGFKKDAKDFRLDPSPIAINKEIQVTVQLRDASGDALFEGTSAPFKNSASAGTVTVSVDPVP